MDLRESVCKVGDCIHLAYDKVRWRAVVSFTFHKRRAVSWLPERLLASQEWLWSAELCFGLWFDLL